MRAVLEKGFVTLWKLWRWLAEDGPSWEPQQVPPGAQEKALLAASGVMQGLKDVLSTEDRDALRIDAGRGHCEA